MLKYDEGTFQWYAWRSVKNEDAEAFCDCGVNVKGLCITEGNAATKAELAGRSVAQKAVKELKKLPGYKDVYVVSMGSHIGHRVTRGLFPRYHLSDADMNVDFPDSIAVAGNVMSPHGYMKIPYPALLPKKVDNVIYAGRCVATACQEYENRRVNFLSYELPRLVAPSMATGEAAGIAAAMCADRGIGFNDVDVKEVQKRIRERGGIC